MKQVLVVDDESTIRLVIQDILEDEGFDVRVAASGREMLSILETERPDLILMDVMMPQLDGREALRLLRQLPGLGQLPVVMMSAAVSPHALNGLATGYLSKPFDVDELVHAVTSIIGPA